MTGLKAKLKRFKKLRKERASFPRICRELDISKDEYEKLEEMRAP